MSKDAIVEGITKRRKRNARKDRKEFENKQILSTMGTGDRVNKDKLSMPAEALLEENLLGILLTQPDLYKSAKGRINEDIFFTEFGKKIFNIYKNDFEAGTEPILSNEALSKEEISILAKLIAIRHSKTDNTLETVLKIITSLENKKQKNEVDKAISSDDENTRKEALAKYLDSLRKNN